MGYGEGERVLLTCKGGVFPQLFTVAMEDRVSKCLLKCWCKEKSDAEATYYTYVSC